MTDYYWFGGAPGARTSDGYAVDAAGNRLANLPLTVKNAADGSVITDLLDQNGAPTTQVSTGDLGYFTFAAPVTVVDVVGGAGTFRAYSNSAIADVVAALPQLNSIQASASASAYSASQSQAAAQASADAVAGKADKTGPEITGKVAKGELLLNVKDYGAKGNGVTDDTAAIQAALDAAFAAPGSTVRIPPGNYKITTEMHVRQNTTVDATGAWIGAYWSNDTGDQMMLSNGYSGDTPTGYTGNGNITIIGGIWDARGHAVNATYSSQFAFAHAHGLTFRDVILRNCRYGHAIEVNSSRAVRITGCRFEGYIDGPTTRATEAVQIDGASPGGFPRFGAYDSTPCNDVLVHGCYFGDSADTGLWYRGVGSHGGVAAYPHMNIRVTNNYFNTTSTGVVVWHWANFVVSGNTVCGAGGIMATTLDPAAGPVADVGPGIISGNVVDCGSVDFGIYVRGYSTAQMLGVIVSGNTVRNQAANKAGIRLEYASRCVVSGNTVRDSLSTSIALAWATSCTVSGNHTYRGAQIGMTVDSSNACIISDNYLLEPGQHGISLSTSGANHVLRGNIVIGAGYTSNNTMVGIRLNSVSNCTVTGNTVRKGSAANQAQYGMQIASGASGTFYQMNDLRLSGVTASLNDVGTGSLTTAVNQV